MARMDPFGRSATRPAQSPQSRPVICLIAAPGMTDPWFRRAVIYLLQNDDEGSAGWSSAADTVATCPAPTCRSGCSMAPWSSRGGPVAEDSLLALADRATAPAHLCRSVGPDLRRRPRRVADAEPFQPLQLFVGYAGWGAGQLESELARHDWLGCRRTPSTCWPPTPRRCGRRCCAVRPGVIRLWATLPPAADRN